MNRPAHYRGTDKALKTIALDCLENDQISTMTYMAAPTMLKEVRRRRGDPKYTPSAPKWRDFLFRIDRVLKKVERQMRRAVAQEGRAS